ncbi:hypothetical protein VR45_37945 [Streptomyces sp. NRRL S-495]|nr:hypothetical protein VR45_37945 [Streptomyces sp. NRRL S-495]
MEERLLRAQAELGAASAERDAVHQALDALRLLSGAPARTDGDPPPAAAAPPVPAEAARDAERAGSTPGAPAPTEPAAVAAGAASGAKKATPARKTPARKASARKTAEPAKAEEAKAEEAKEKPAKATPAKTEPTRASARGAKTGGGTKTAAKQDPTARTGRTASRSRPVDAEPPTAAPAAGRRTVTDADSVLAVLSGSAGPMRAREVSEKLGLEPLEANVNAVRTRLERLAKDGRAQRPGRGLYTATARGSGA